MVRLEDFKIRPKGSAAAARFGAAHIRLGPVGRLHRRCRRPGLISIAAHVRLVFVGVVVVDAVHIFRFDLDDQILHHSAARRTKKRLGRVTREK